MARIGGPAAWTMLALLIGVGMALPVIWLAMTAFKPAAEYVSPSIRLWPDAPSLAHFRAVIATSGVPAKFGNSLLVTVGAVALALAAGFPAAYVLVRVQWPKRLDSAFLLFVLLIKLVPPLVLAAPLYQILRTLGILDTLAGLVLVYQVHLLPLAIWMLLGFVRDVPVAYEEAARIDGAGPVRCMMTITLPIMAPGIVATTILLAIMAWNEFSYALLFIQSPERFTLPVYIATLITEDETFWGRLAAIGVTGTLPIIILLAVFQQRLLRGLAGGLK